LEVLTGISQVCIGIFRFKLITAGGPPPGNFRLEFRQVYLPDNVFYPGILDNVKQRIA
jgi:hypothetical protein